MPGVNRSSRRESSQDKTAATLRLVSSRLLLISIPLFIYHQKMEDDPVHVFYVFSLLFTPLFLAVLLPRACQKLFVSCLDNCRKTSSVCLVNSDILYESSKSN